MWSPLMVMVSQNEIADGSSGGDLHVSRFKFQVSSFQVAGSHSGATRASASTQRFHQEIQKPEDFAAQPFEVIEFGFG